MRTLTLIIALLIVAIQAGCEGAKSIAFDVTVENRSQRPVTIWLTKNDIPPEAGWLSPEQLSASGADGSGPIPGVVVPPGQQAGTGPVKGFFYKRTSAILRVYDGQLSFAQILSTKEGGFLRRDLVLPAGESRWVVLDRPTLTIEPAATVEPMPVTGVRQNTP